MVLFLIVLLSCIYVNYAQQKVLNPDGYIVGNMMQYSFCDGNIEGVAVWAINQCIYGGLVGYPYPNEYAIFSPVSFVNNVPYITVTQFSDANCTVPRNNVEQIAMNECTTSGNAIYFYFSADIPSFSNLDNGAFSQIWYDYSGSTSTNCSNTAIYGTVLGANWWADVCHFDCGGGSSSCDWNDYSSNGAVVSIYSTSYCEASDITSATLIRPSCAMAITTYSSKTEGEGISTRAAIGITFAATFVGLLIVELLMYYCFLRKRWSQPHVTYNVENVNPVASVEPNAPILEASLIDPTEKYY